MNCIIVDDEPLARKGIQLLLENFPQLHIAGSFNNTISASKFLQSESVDLIFLDIKMPGTSGIDFARTIPPNTLVIFVTAFSEYAVDSYDVKAVDYVLKPINEVRFFEAVEKALSYHTLLSRAEEQVVEDITNEYVFVRADRRLIKIYFTDIIYVEALKDYIIIHTDSQRVITRMNLKAIQDQLPSSCFARVSKSFIINAEKITSVNNNSVTVGKQEILIGSNFREQLFDKFINKKILSSNK